MLQSFLSSLWLLLLLVSCQQPSKQKVNTRGADSIRNAVGCAPPITNDQAWYTSGRKAPLFSGLGGLHFSVTTQSREAQQYVDQALMLSFAFNHAEAARSFFEATRLDSTCAMAWWGFAYVLGPNYNGGMEPNHFRRAYEASQKALRFAAAASPKERALIEALSKRYAADSLQDRPALDQAYATAMRKVYQQYPDDPTIAALFAESLMDLHPWNLYQKNGKIQPWTPEILSVLKQGLKRDGRHAGLNHFYIHATEMSNQAESALASADLLMSLVPGAGHLLHMPSHTYIRVGKYHEGVVANQQAALVDSQYVEACHAQGAYPLAYYPHNLHFLSACATLGGESKQAINSAIATANHAHQSLLREPGWATLQHYYSIPWFVQVKLAMWTDILQSKPPESDLKYPMVIWHYAQGMARLAQNQVSQAKQHLVEIETLMKDSSLKALSIWGINSVYDISRIANKTLAGEIYAKEKNYVQSIKLLREAVAQEDALNYNEPPDWFFSIRHHLGAVLIEAGMYQEALKVYQEDLKVFRQNGWALKGMMNAYEKLGETHLYAQMKMEFELAWKYADREIAASRIW